jgi:hypothetical protein
MISQPANAGGIINIVTVWFAEDVILWLLIRQSRTGLILKGPAETPFNMLLET